MAVFSVTRMGERSGKLDRELVVPRRSWQEAFRTFDPKSEQSVFAA